MGLSVHSLNCPATHYSTQTSSRQAGLELTRSSCLCLAGAGKKACTTTHLDKMVLPFPNQSALCLFYMLGSNSTSAEYLKVVSVQDSTLKMKGKTYQRYAGV